MRKKIKNEIIKMLNDVSKLGNQIFNDLQNEYESLPILQNMAIEIGEKIEQEDEQASGAVHKLEIYCEEIWKCYESAELLTQKEILQRANALLNDVVSDIRKIQSQYEVLFLPYKASMWDCMESVYKEMSNCEQFLCRVMPIPYAHRNNIGKAVVLHYEGNLFPDGVPIVNYREVNLKEEHPEVIFFHNPYDQYNHVTSVAPEYYSSNLKQLTDLLVYIPYFVCLNTIEEHYCMLPGVYNADWVIVQSQLIKENYRQWLLKNMSHYYKEMDALIEQKIMVCGSPKFDWVRKLEETEISFPFAWEKVIKGKKVLLYNTHLSEIMPQYADLFIKKILYVFQIMKNQKDFLLLWRPHPLTKHTLEAYNPELREKYEEIVEQYKQQQIGIFDESNNMKQAFAVSDAYYGAGGSLLPMYLLSGKPIMLDSISINKENEAFLSYNWFTASVVDGNDLWFVPERGAKLLHCNIGNGEIDFCGNIPGESQLLYGNYAGMVKVDKYLILAPSMAKELTVYDISEKIFYKVPVENPENVTDKFIWGLAVGNRAFFIGYFYPAILEYDVDKKLCQVYLFENINEFNCRKDNTPFFEDSFCLVKDSLMFPCYNSGYIMEFNIISRQYSMHLIDKDVHLRTISFDGEHCWISMKEKEGFLLWNPDTKELHKELLKNSVHKDNELRYYYTCNVKDIIYVFPCADNGIYVGQGRGLKKLDLGKELNEIAEREYLTYDLERRKFLFLNKTEDGKIYTYSAVSNKVYFIDNFEIKDLEIKIPEQMMQEFIDDYEKEKRIYKDESFIMYERESVGGLKGYLRHVLKWDIKNVEVRKKKVETWLGIPEQDAGNIVTAKVLERLESEE